MGHDNKFTSNNSSELYVDKNKINEQNNIAENDSASNHEIVCKCHNLLIENNSDNYHKNYKTYLYNQNFKEIELNNYSTENNDKGLVIRARQRSSSRLLRL